MAPRHQDAGVETFDPGMLQVVDRGQPHHSQLGTVDRRPTILDWQGHVQDRDACILDAIGELGCQEGPATQFGRHLTTEFGGHGLTDTPLDPVADELVDEDHPGDQCRHHDDDDKPASGGAHDQIPNNSSMPTVSPGRRTTARIAVRMPGM